MYLLIFPKTIFRFLKHKPELYYLQIPSIILTIISNDLEPRFHENNCIKKTTNEFFFLADDDYIQQAAQEENENNKSEEGDEERVVYENPDEESESTTKYFVPPSTGDYKFFAKCPSQCEVILGDDRIIPEEKIISVEEDTTRGNKRR